MFIMKRIILSGFMILVCSAIFSQEKIEIPWQAKDEEPKEEERSKFRRDNIFIGGSINLGFGNGSFAIGGVPEIGYSVSKWLDAGLAFNLNYQTQRIDNFSTGSTLGRIRSFNYGAGVFARIWPVNFLHIAIQPEYNWIKVTSIDEITNQKNSTTYKAESLLVGVGYGGREIGRRISYITVMIDLAENINSPYRDQFNRAQPIIRTGFGIYLKPLKR